MIHTIGTEICIAGSVEAVWHVLTDFGAHAAWDPFLVRIEGLARVGERLRVTFKNGVALRPKVTQVRAPHLLEWHGKLVVPGLLDGRHRFELVGEAGGTRLVHSERLTGLLVPLLRGLLSDAARDFEAFDAALKARVEAQGRGNDPGHSVGIRKPGTAGAPLGN